MLMHDLVYAGVGGWTVEEFKERMSSREFEDWIEWTHRRGTPHLGMRLELEVAMILMWALKLRGVKDIDIKTFMPYTGMEKKGDGKIDDEGNVLGPGGMKIEDAMSVLVGSFMRGQQQKRGNKKPRNTDG